MGSGLIEDRFYGVVELSQFKRFSDNCIKVCGEWVFR